MVEQGELSRARQAFTASAMAPGDATTLAALKNPERRPPTPLDPVPQDVLNYQPPEKAKLEKKQFLETLRGALRGSAAARTGLRFEHLKVLLDEEEATDLLYQLAKSLAQAEVPQEVADTLRKGTLVALQKADGGVRGIVVGEVLRRLVARSLAKEYCRDFEEVCGPFQCALSTPQYKVLLYTNMVLIVETNGSHCAY